MMNGGGFCGGFGMFFMFFFWILLLAGLVILVVWFVNQSKTGSTKNEISALDILKKRYAEGEIDKEEFGKKKKDLS